MPDARSSRPQASREQILATRHEVVEDTLAQLRLYYPTSGTLTTWRRLGSADLYEAYEEPVEGVERHEVAFACGPADFAPYDDGEGSGDVFTDALPLFGGKR